MKTDTDMIFKSPWKVERNNTNPILVTWDVWTDDGYLIADNLTLRDANRISHLPELYDVLLQSVREHCFHCSETYEDITDFEILDKWCKKKSSQCTFRSWWELLREVRRGE